MRRWQLILVLAFCALTTASVVWMVLRDRAREQRVSALMTQRNAIDPEAVARAVRTMKLITVQITSSIRVEKKIESMFFGEGKASIQTPVVASYGSDLSKMRSDGIRIINEGTRARILVRIPRPVRIAVEVFAEGERSELEKSWRRYAWWSGREQLDQARLEVPGEARALELMPIHRLKVENDTREQMAQLIRMIVGGTSSDGTDGQFDVDVKFEDEE